MPRIAIYGIAKNEQQFAERFYNSCKDADVVLVGVDEGDTTGDILTSLGAQVCIVKLQQFRFDAYRNAVLQQLPSDIDICISLDLDEVLPSNWRQLVERAWQPGVTRLHYTLQWSPTTQFNYDRIHARHGYIWRHANHEAVYATGNERVAQCDLVVTHLPDKTKDRSKNLPLLELAANEEPNSVRMQWYLAREYYDLGSYTKAIDRFKHYLGKQPTWLDEISWACIYVAWSYQHIGDMQNAEAYLHMGIRLNPNFRDPYFELAIFYHNQGFSRQALEQLHLALRLPTKRTMFFQQNGSYSVDIDLYKVRLLDALGKRQQAQQYLAKVQQAWPNDNDVAGWVKYLN